MNRAYADQKALLRRRAGHGIFRRDGRIGEDEAAARATSISQVLYATLGLSENLVLEEDAFVDRVVRQCSAIVG